MSFIEGISFFHFSHYKYYDVDFDLGMYQSGYTLNEMPVSEGNLKRYQENLMSLKNTFLEEVSENQNIIGDKSNAVSYLTDPK